MQHASINPPASPSSEANLPNTQSASYAAAQRQSSEVVRVGDVRLGTPHAPLTDESREAAIEHAGVLVYRYMGIWERTGDFGARGDADRARRLMEQLIAGRSPAQVARMLAEQAKRMAREPGA